MDAPEEYNFGRASREGLNRVQKILERLEDVRWTLIKCATALIVAMVVCLLIGNRLVSILERPLEKANALAAGGARIKLDFLDPAGPFFSALHVAFFGGFLVSSPLILYFLLKALLPALKMVKTENSRPVFAFMAVGTGLFLLGVSFCYFVVMPLALHAAVNYSDWFLGKTPVGVKTWRAELYLSFVTKCMLGMGLGFELPVVLLTLVRMEILDYARLAAMRRYMVVICLVLGALLTTPEVITQVIMAIPLYGLYEISVWIAWYWERKDRAKSATNSGRED